MGKAARKKRMATGPSPRKSAFARVLKESAWARDNPSSSTGARLAFALTSLLPRARVIVFDPSQAAAVGGLAWDDIDRGMAQAQAPFPNTFFDFGEIDVGGGWLLAGALWSEEAESVLASCRFSGTDDWKTIAISLRGIGQALSRKIVRDYENDENYSRPEADFERLGDVVLGAMMVLESANVELVESQGPPRGHQAHGVPHFDVVIRQNAKRSLPRGEGQGAIEFSHRFEVRGNFAHHYETTQRGEPNPLFEKWMRERPEKALTINGKLCFRVWRPPYIKGPEDKPLIPKRRIVTAPNRDTDRDTTEFSDRSEQDHHTEETA